MDRKIEGIIAALMTVIWLVLLNVFFSGKVTAPDQVKILPDMRITYIRLEATPEYTAVSYDDVTMKNNSNVISGAIGAKGYHLDSPVDLAVFNTERLIFKHSIRINQNFKFNLPEKLNKDARIKFELLDRHGKMLNQSKPFEVAKWCFLPNKPEAGAVNDFGTVLDRNLSRVGTFNIVEAPKTGLSFLHEMHYNTTLQMEMHKTDVAEDSRLIALGRSINPIRQFATSIMLPTISDNSVNWSSPQGSAIEGEKMYVVYEDSRHKNFGRVVSFDLKKLRLLDTDKTKKNILRVVESRVRKGILIQGDLLTALNSIEVGPYIYTGHGQAFAYNKQTKMFVLTALTNGSAKQIFEQIDPKTLSVKKTGIFDFWNSENDKKVTGERNLAIDKKGNLYIVSVVGNSDVKDTNLKRGDILLYHGKLEHGKLSMSLAKTVVRSKPGYYTQFLSIDESGRLYFLTDGAYLGIPSTKWVDGSLEFSDINMAVYATESGGTREFESQVWECEKSMILTNRGSELMLGSK